MMLANMASGHVAMRLNARGPNLATVSACASSAHAIGEAMRWIRDDMADVVYAGGCEAPVSRLSVAGFNAMNALSTRNDDPARASRPFDLYRDGFVVGEGAAVLVLEERGHAIARGARILAEVAGYGATDDANHIVQPAPEGEGAARACASRWPTRVISGRHRLSERPWHLDAAQRKIRNAVDQGRLWRRAYRLPISSTKSMTGHLLGAAGSMEAIFSVLAMRDQVAPPTINYQTPDPDCDLDYIPNSSRPLDIAAVMTNSMGFGGHNVSLVLRRDESGA